MACSNMKQQLAISYSTETGLSGPGKLSGMSMVTLPVANLELVVTPKFELVGDLLVVHLELKLNLSLELVHDLQLELAMNVQVKLLELVMNPKL